MQAPGLAAIQQLSPVVQQAAADPQSAVSLLMAAASALVSESPADVSQRRATSVTDFVQAPMGPIPGPAPLAPPAPPPIAPAPHGDAPGVVPGVMGPTVVDSTPAGSPLLPGFVYGAPESHVPTQSAGPDQPPHGAIDRPHAVGPASPVALAPAPGAAPDLTLAEASGPAADPAPLAHPIPPPPEPAPAPAPAPEPVAAPAGMIPDAPPTQDFLYPSIGNGCLADGGNSIATALSVAGPAEIPKPGPQAGQTAYVFTAVGTAGPADVQKLPLNVTWVNLSTGRSGTTALTPHPEINPDGPTTLTAIVDTGSGSILSTIFGQVTTVERQCNFMPTIGSTVVP